MMTGSGLPGLWGAPIRYLLCAAACLLLIWAFAVPIFEAPDEQSHWEIARYLYDHHRLPFYDSHLVEANQPPLYYVLIAPFAKPTPWPPSGMFTDSQGRYLPIYPPKVWVNTDPNFHKFWPIRKARLLTVLFSILAVVFCYLAGAELTRRPMTGFLAAGLMAFLPQFLYRGMNVSNDALVTATSAVALYAIVCVLQRGYSVRLGVVTAMLIAMAFLSKVNAISLVGPFGLAIVWERSPWLIRLRRLSVFAVSLAIVSPWLIRNQILYGDVLASKQMYIAVPGLMDPKSITSPFFVVDFPRVIWRSFIGGFGGAMTLWLPEAVYKGFALLAAAAVLGLVWRLLRKPETRRPLAILFTVPVIALALAVIFNLTQSQPQGRYLFPALSAIAVLTAVGLESLPMWNESCSRVLVTLLAVLNVAILCGIIVPTYWSTEQRPGRVPDVMVSDALMRTTAGPLHDGDSLMQSFVAHGNDLSRVEIEVATYTKVIPSGWLRIQLLEGTGDREVASWRIPLSGVADNSFVALDFPPIPDSQNKPYAIVIEPNQAPAGYAVTVWLSDHDVYPDGVCRLNGRDLHADTSFRTFAAPAAALSHPSDSAAR